MKCNCMNQVERRFLSRISLQQILHCYIATRWRCKKMSNSSRKWMYCNTFSIVWLFICCHWRHVCVLAKNLYLTKESIKITMEPMHLMTKVLPLNTQASKRTAYMCDEKTISTHKEPNLIHIYKRAEGVLAGLVFQLPEKICRTPMVYCVGKKNTKKLCHQIQYYQGYSSTR